MDWKLRSEANLLPLSIEQRWLARALLEWVYNGEMYDFGYPCETCELCEHPDLRYQFKIINQHNGNELLVGSECINKFRIAAVDELGNVLDREASRRKVNRDLRFLVAEARRKRQINSLLQLLAVEQDFDISSFIDYVQNRGAFTPNQLSVIFQKLRQHSIEYDPRDFKIIIKRAREKTQLLEMPEWKRQRLLPALSPAQKKWLVDHSGSSASNRGRRQRGQSERYSPVCPPRTPDGPSATHDRIGEISPVHLSSDLDPHRSPVDGFPPTGPVEPAQGEHLSDAAAELELARHDKGQSRWERIWHWIRRPRKRL